MISTKTYEADKTKAKKKKRQRKEMFNSRGERGRDGGC